MSNECYVNIYEDGKIEPCEKVGPFDMKSAQKVSDGVSVNLNHDEYHIRIEEKE